MERMQEENSGPRWTSHSSTILRVATAVPDHRIDQESVKQSLGCLLSVGAERRSGIMAMFDNALVEQRWSVLPLEKLRERRTLSETMSLYRQYAIQLGRKVADDCLRGAGVPAKSVDMVITLSCTGFMIPSLDAYLAGELGFRSDIRRLPITELGCVAGAAAIARAHDFLRGHPDAKVLIVAVELPTLSFQRDDGSPAQLVSTALFGDGAAAVLMSGRPERGVQVVDTEAHFMPGTLDALGFDLHDDGFHVRLAKTLPDTLRTSLASVALRLLARAGVGLGDLDFCVLHPGGRRILTAIEEALFFVLERWLKGAPLRPGALGLLGAFGPGLSTELCLLRCA